MSLSAEARAYYARGVEDGRHATYSRLEYLRLRIILGESLPQPPARVLDVGGGAGIWASHLQAGGYEVVTTDLLEAHPALARARGVRHCAAADARALPFADATFDAVLLLGPLYHLASVGDRLRALRECHRVTRDSGVLVAAVISRYTMLLQGWLCGQDQQPGFHPMVAADLLTGQHANPERFPGWFTTSYLHQSAEARNEAAKAGWARPELRAVQGFGHFLPGLAEILDDADRSAALLTALAQTDREPDLIGLSGHVALVAVHDPGPDEYEG
jgi:SAM-dependent methyltransferase